MQGAQLKFSKLVDCQESSADARFVKQLEHKTLLDCRHGEPSFLSEVCTLSTLPQQRWVDLPAVCVMLRVS